MRQTTNQSTNQTNGTPDGTSSDERSKMDEVLALLLEQRQQIDRKIAALGLSPNFGEVASVTPPAIQIKAASAAEARPITESQTVRQEARAPSRGETADLNKRVE